MQLAVKQASIKLPVTTQIAIIFDMEHIVPSVQSFVIFRDLELLMS